ncbi:uncharacterized protein LOC119022697 isoform X2 [Acanthopagrus latus]|uniref:uncharacterized protein LOC119022697 isoform X2 n=1 Tax=Acanthopagrus latus TaxID=8177 RepID=UPI00187BDEA9|nr:uncharacterized protein LOC119022697 isoform X2 [Acanthopagrus latus]
MRRRRRRKQQRWGGGRATPQWMKEESGGGEKKKGKKNSPSAQGSVLIRSTDPTHPLEEEAVEITRRGAEGGLSEDGRRAEETAGRAEEDEDCSELVMESGTYFEVEVEVPGSDSDEETLTASWTPSEVIEGPDDVTVLHPAYEPPNSVFSLLGGGAMDEVICGRSLLRLLRVLRRTVLPAHWVPVLTAGPLLQLLKCSKLSSMSDTIVHVHPDHCFYITVQSRLLPDTHSLYTTHTLRITHLSQLVSLVAPPCLTCLPCLRRRRRR